MKTMIKQLKAYRTMASTVHFTIPAKKEFVGLVRLAISGLAQSLPFDSDTIEDIKLVMSEVCTNMVLDSSVPGDPPVLTFSVSVSDDDITIDIDSTEAIGELVSASSANWDGTSQSGYGMSIITALVDKVELISNGDNHSILRLKKLT